jgi:hypothetical protein
MSASTKIANILVQQKTFRSPGKFYTLDLLLVYTDKYI